MNKERNNYFNYFRIFWRITNCKNWAIVFGKYIVYLYICNTFTYYIRIYNLFIKSDDY